MLNQTVIGMNRLAIVDEQYGQQPFTDNAGVFCIFNGEIYNCLQLRQELSKHVTFRTSCDTEVVLQSYIYWGEHFVEKLDGKFSLCIIDVTKDQFILARDHIGIKPLYYANWGDSILFSSEMKSFCDMAEVHEIKSIPPGAYMINGIIKRYYDVPPLVESNETTLRGLKNRLIDAVRKRIPDDANKIACLLSGGLDSSIILYIASQLSVEVEAFTFAHPSQSSADLDAARRLCQDLNIHHVIVSPDEEELMDFYLKQGVYLTESYEPVLVRNAVSYHYVCKAVRKKGYKFVLNGEGADELFGGYAFFKEINVGIRDEAIRYSLLKLHQTYLQMADRASMYTTLEARVPYMDKALIDYSMTFPSNFRINGEEDKWALRQVFKEELPVYITQRAKTGMNEGAGFGRNSSTESIYHKAIKRYYERNPSLKKQDLDVCKKYNEYLVNLDNLEEVYLFPRFVENNYHRHEWAKERLQLNTPLIREI
ncbi:MAG: asparagine synthase-related protein [Gammaproteobacteria bacterium]|nr:asparagine synthase-related protein [Gammaproteobacteria bacterium]